MTSGRVLVLLTLTITSDRGSGASLKGKELRVVLSDKATEAAVAALMMQMHDINHATPSLRTRAMVHDGQSSFECDDSDRCG